MITSPAAPRTPLLSALKWALLGDWMAKAAPPLVFLILAGVLAPADFGVVSAALMVVAFSQILWEAGLGKALVRWDGDISSAANAAFRLNVSLGLIVAAVLIFAAPAVAGQLFADPRVSPVIRVMSLDVVLGAVSAVHRALLQRDLQFQKLFWARLPTVVAPAALSIPLALAGFGYWALVAGMLVGQLAQAIILWRSSTWRPSSAVDRRIALEIARFGRWVWLTGLVAWIYAWADSFIAGHYFGTAVMGLYRVGNQAGSAVFGILFAAAAPVLYSRFSARAPDMAGVRDEVLKINGMVGAISLPLSLAVVVFSPIIERALFTEQWRGVGLIVAVIAAKDGVLWIFAYNVEAYRALGKPHIETAIAVLSALVHPIVLVLCAIRGFEAFLFGRGVVLCLIGVVIHAGFALVVFGRASVQRAYFKLVLISVVCVVLGSVHYLVARSVGAPILYAVDAAIVVAAFGSAFIIERTALAQLVTILRQRRLGNAISG